jgi:hypothetical protein
LSDQAFSASNLRQAILTAEKSTTLIKLLSLRSGCLIRRVAQSFYIQVTCEAVSPGESLTSGTLYPHFRANRRNISRCRFRNASMVMPLLGESPLTELTVIVQQIRNLAK